MYVFQNFFSVSLESCESYHRKHQKSSRHLCSRTKPLSTCHRTLFGLTPVHVSEGGSLLFSSSFNNNEESPSWKPPTAWGGCSSTLCLAHWYLQMCLPSTGGGAHSGELNLPCVCVLSRPCAWACRCVFLNFVFVCIRCLRSSMLYYWWSSGRHESVSRRKRGGGAGIYHSARLHLAGPLCMDNVQGL